jgi:hypothetical protein
MKLKLPTASFRLPCFKVCDTAAYLAINKTLYAFSPSSIKHLKALNVDQDVIMTSDGVSYYSKGFLYCSNDDGAARRIEIEELS